jgi:hypothetical protein
MAYQKKFDVAVLITNDSDLVEPVRIVRRELNLPVGILNPQQHHSAVLKADGGAFNPPTATRRKARGRNSTLLLGWAQAKNLRNLLIGLIESYEKTNGEIKTLHITPAPPVPPEKLKALK